MLRGSDETVDGSRERAEALLAKSESARVERADAFGPYAGESPRIAASTEATQPSLRLSTRLGDAADASASVGTVEHLLAALEAMGVDNARIEVEGTGELPILDGSAYPFCYHAARVGLTAATADGAPDGAETERRAWRLDEPVTVREGDAFISLYPDAVTKLTYGIDFTYKSRAIGKQWESWTPSEDGRFADVLARARTFATMPDIMAYFRAGYIKGGPSTARSSRTGTTSGTRPCCSRTSPRGTSSWTSSATSRCSPSPGTSAFRWGTSWRTKPGTSCTPGSRRKCGRRLKRGKPRACPLRCGRARRAEARRTTRRWRACRMSCRQ